MPELHLHRSGGTLDIILGEHRSSFPLADIVVNTTTWEYIYDDATAYGRDLFDKTFRDEQMRSILANLPANERLLLVADDPLVAAIPWEYLRDGNNKLLASRLNLVRGLPKEQRGAAFEFSAQLEIVAVPVSPIDEPVILDVEREWKNLVEAVRFTRPPRLLTLKRVRPPTRSQLERNLGRRCTSIVHFMGHSASQDGKAFLVFEDARARKHLVDAADFLDSLNARVFLVVLNSCLSAVVAHTTFGNIAQTLVYRGIPYALGMQFILPDDAALVLSDALYDFLLHDQTVEEAVMHTRRALEEPEKLPGFDPAWLAGIPVLYTSLQAPATTIVLPAGQPEIQPDPVQLEQACDLTALPVAQHFVGRSEQISKVVGILLNPHQRGFVLLHGLGGIGKTALARAVAERLSYHYGDCVLAYSFETFASLDANNRCVVDETFADRFITRLAHFYRLDPKDASLYPTPTALQQAILQRRAHVRSLLVLDNIETLVDAQENSPAAQALATFVARLKEGEGAVLLTSRSFPPSDWGEYQLVSLTGLTEEAGAELFLALLPSDRKHFAPPDARKALSGRVQGHPLSIRLLAGRFADTTATDLDTFLKCIEAELATAEQATPTSMEDPHRQKTLYACLDYSIRQLTTEQRKVLDTISLFQAPFPPTFAFQLLGDEEQTATQLQTLVRLSLLEISMSSRTFLEGELMLLEMHPMVRWYIQHYQSEPGAALREQYGEIYVSLTSHEVERYDRDARLRYLLYQSLPDCEAAIQCLPPDRKSTLAYYLAQSYQRLGQNRRALALYELSLEIDQELGDIRSVAVKQSAMADVLFQQSKPQEAMALYERALAVYQELGDIRSVATTQSAMAHVLFQQSKLQEAMALYERVLPVYQELGDIRSVATTQHAMAEVLSWQGKLQEAMTLYEQSLRTKQELGDIREVAVTQSAMADVLKQQGKLQEAMALYEQSLRTKQELGDIREMAVTQSAMAGVLIQQDKPQEAIALYERALAVYQELGDIRSVAVTQTNISQLLFQQGEHQRALMMAWQAYTSLRQHEYAHAAQFMQQLLATIKEQILGPEQFNLLWAELLNAPQPDWLLNIEMASQEEDQGLVSAKQLEVIVVNTITVLTEMTEKRKEWREAMESAFHQAQHIERTQEAEFFAAVLAILDEQIPSLPEDHPFRTDLEKIQAGIAAGGSHKERISFAVSNEVMQAVQHLINAENWEATRQVLDTQRALLFRPEVETLFERNIAQARSVGEERAARLLEVHLALLRECKASSIEEAFAKLTSAEEDEDALPFDTELITQSIAALLGSPQEKMEYLQYLASTVSETTDGELKALLNTIQLALFSQDLSQLGRELKGVYRQAWETIAASVEAGGVDPRLFETLASNTLAVLGPSASRLGEWRSNLAEVRNQATARGDRNMAALLDAVIGLLDTGGDPAELGEDLKGIYAKTWQAIVERLSK